MTFFGPDLRNGLPIGLGSVAGFGSAQPFSPLSLFAGGVQGAWFDPSDSTTLFSDRAGTTPCAAPGAGALVPVGAMLDERAPGYSVFFDGTGDSLTAGTTSTFNFMHNASALFTFECWVYRTAGSTDQFIFCNITTSASIGVNISFSAANKLNLEIYRGVGNSPVIDVASTATIPTNQWTHVAVTYDQSLASNNAKFYIDGVFDSQATKTANAPSGSNASNAARIGISPNAGLYPLTGYISNLRIVNAVLPISLPTAPLTPVTGTALLTCGTSWTGNPAITKNGDARVDGLNPFTASPVGNHAIAANDTTARPELSARVNLLERTEDFGNAYWGNIATSVITAAGTAPNGTNTANKIYPTSNGNYRGIFKAVTLVATSYVATIYAKAVEKNIVAITDFPGSVGVAWFNLSTGVVSNVAVGYTATIMSVGDGWYQCSIVATATVGGPRYYQLFVADSAGSPAVTANGTDGILVWGADLRPANIGTTIPAYQRVADQYTYDTVGFPRYLAFNGTSSAMSTPANVNLSGTDKATVFAGVRKLAAGTGQLVELSIDVSTNDGSFSMPSDSGTGTWSTASKGTNPIVLAQSATNSYVAPVTTVNTGLHDLSLAADVARLRVNGAQVATSGVAAAGGNFGTYPLYIGARNLSTFFLNGNIYSLIVAGSAVSAGNITATEQWVAGKTGITI